MEKKNNVGTIIIIVVLVLVVLGLCGYIAYDKGIIFNNNETEETNTVNEKDEEENKVPEEIEETENYDYVEISAQLSENLSDFLVRYAYNNGVDLLSLTDLRLGLVNLLLDDVQVYNNGTVQPFPYVSYDKYSAKYKELYGDNYSLETDLANVSSVAIADRNNEYVGENNISWNNTGVSGSTYALRAQNISYDSGAKLYTLSGTYAKTDFDGSVSNGTFTIKYTKSNNVKNLKSIVLTASN